MKYFVLNTNKSNDPEDDYYMIQEQKAAAFFTPWKHKIEHIGQGDIVFLYRSGEGIVAVGKASGTVEKRSYQHRDDCPEEEYCQHLADFKLITKPLTADKIKMITGVNHVFQQTMFEIEEASGSKVYEYITRWSD